MKKERTVSIIIGLVIVSYFVINHFFYLGNYMPYLVFLFPIVGIVVLLQTIIRGAQTKNWKLSTAKIIKSEVVKQEIRNKRDHYRWDIQYEYKVFAKSFVNNVLAYKYGMAKSFGHTNRQAVSEFVNKFPLNKEVPVYYNPQNPKRSVLEQGTDLKAILAPLAIIVFSLVFIYLFWQKGVFHF